MKLRSFLSRVEFDTNIVNQRWTTEYYNASVRARNFPETSSKNIELIVSETETEPAKVKTQAEKYHSLMKTCQFLASVGREGGMSTYENQHEQVQKILEQ